MRYLILFRRHMAKDSKSPWEAGKAYVARARAEQAGRKLQRLSVTYEYLIVEVPA